MTIKIIKRGNIPGAAVHVLTCRNCKTEFQFSQSDAEMVTDWRDGDYLKINCPVCGRTCTKDQSHD